MTFEQDFSIFEQTLRTRQRFGLLCGHRQRKSTKQPRNPFCLLFFIQLFIPDFNVFIMLSGEQPETF